MCVVDTTDLELFDSETDFPNFLIFTPSPSELYRLYHRHGNRTSYLGDAQT